MKFVAVIPARKGSKGLVGKNTRLFAGKPLIEYSIVESVGCSMIDETIVSSDDELALALATNYLCTIHKRPSNLAGDDVDMLAVLKDVITSFSLNLKYDALVLMQPTSPLRFGNILNKCLMKFKSDNPASLMTIVSTNPGVLKSLIQVGTEYLPIRDERFLFCKRQDLPKIYKVDGNIFIFNINSIIAGDNLYLQPCKYVLNDIRNGIDIDTIQDFQEAESLLIKNKNFIE